MAKWFATGNMMADGVTPRTVCAKTEVEVAECVMKGWKEVGSDDEPIEAVSGEKVEGVTGVGTQKKGPAHKVLGQAVKDAKKKKEKKSE